MVAYDKNTYVWKMTPKYWAIQTGKSKIANKLEQRKTFRRFLTDMTKYLRGFKFGPCTLAEALKKVEGATALKFKKDRSRGIWVGFSAQK